MWCFIFTQRFSHNLSFLSAIFILPTWVTCPSVAPHAHTMRTVSQVVVMAPMSALPIFLAYSCMQHQGWLHQCRTCLCFRPQLWTGIGIYLNYRVVQVTTVVTCSLETKSGTNSVLANCHRGVVTVFLSLILLYTWRLLLHWKLLEGRHHTSLI